MFVFSLGFETYKLIFKRGLFESGRIIRKFPYIPELGNSNEPYLYIMQIEWN